MTADINQACNPLAVIFVQTVFVIIHFYIEIALLDSKLMECDKSTLRSGWRAERLCCCAEAGSRWAKI